MIECLRGYGGNRYASLVTHSIEISDLRCENGISDSPRTANVVNAWVVEFPYSEYSLNGLYHGQTYDIDIS